MDVEHAWGGEKIRTKVVHHLHLSYFERNQSPMEFPCRRLDPSVCVSFSFSIPSFLLQSVQSWINAFPAAGDREIRDLNINILAPIDLSIEIAGNQFVEMTGQT